MLRRLLRLRRGGGRRGRRGWRGRERKPVSAAIREAASDDGLPAGELARMLLDGDRAGVAAAMGAAAGAVDLSRLRLFTQRGIYMRRILDEMGIGDVEAEIRDLRAAPGDPGAAERADRLEGARERLVEEARDLVERNIALFADPASARLREEFLERMRLANIPPRDFERVRRIVRRMAKRLASRHARRRFNRKDGRLDPRRTIRSNIAHDGVPFRLAWRYTRVERPKVVAVCDVSGSVAAAAQFLLLLLYSLREVMSDLRAFAFSSHLEDVDDLLAGRPFEEAAAGIMERIGFRPTDYGPHPPRPRGRLSRRHRPQDHAARPRRRPQQPGRPRDGGPRPALPAREAGRVAEPRAAPLLGHGGLRDAPLPPLLPRRAGVQHPPPPRARGRRPPRRPPLTPGGYSKRLLPPSSRVSGRRQ